MSISYYAKMVSLIAALVLFPIYGVSACPCDGDDNTKVQDPTVPKIPAGPNDNS